MACLNLYYLSCELYCGELYCGVHVYLVCLMICDGLCLSFIMDSCHIYHTCVGTPQFFANVYGQALKFKS
jgi:hypothetical protein